MNDIGSQITMLFGSKWIYSNKTVYKVSIYTTHWKLHPLQLFKLNN